MDTNRLKWATRRGMLELDLILLPFLENVYPTLTAKECDQVLEAVVESVNGRVPVMVGTGTNSTKSSLDHDDPANHEESSALLRVKHLHNWIYPHICSMSNPQNPARWNEQYK